MNTVKGINVPNIADIFRLINVLYIADFFRLFRDHIFTISYSNIATHAVWGIYCLLVSILHCFIFLVFLLLLVFQ